MDKELTIGEIVKSVSKTHSFDKEKLIFLNTSDVLEGKILVDKYSDVESLKGQAKKTIENDDILFSEIRPKNKRYAYVNVENTEDYVVSTKLMVLRKYNKAVLNKYFYYFLTYDGTLDYLQMRAENRIGSFPQITFDILKPIKIKVPSIKEQEAIVKIISALDKKIELNNKVNDNLEQIAKTLYDYWFVQFDFPDKNGKPYKSTGGKLVYDDMLKREIPANWRSGVVNDLGQIVTGGTPSTEKKEYFTEKGIPWITPKDLALTSNKYISHGAMDITELGLKNSSAKLMPANSVLLTTRAPIGYLGISLNDVCTNQGFKSIVPNPEYGAEYTYYTIQSMVPLLQTLGVGSTFKEISKEVFANVQTILPDKSVLKSFNSVISSISRRRIYAETETQQLSELRDWLLPMLMNGQVKID